MNPASTLAYSIRGSLYLAQKKYEQAVADFSKAIELCPDRVDPYYNRACCFELLGRNADAVESFRTFLQAIPEGTQSYGALTDEVKDRLQRLGK
jgi:tetratricopeptide (TPR) repeat protein